jgi:hypothetical protein
MLNDGRVCASRRRYGVPTMDRGAKRAFVPIRKGVVLSGGGRGESSTRKHVPRFHQTTKDRIQHWSCSRW